MKGILKRCGFGAVMAVMLWGVTGCDFEPKIDNQTFDELAVEEITVEEAYIEEPYTKLFPYGLVIRINSFSITPHGEFSVFHEKGYEGPYAFYSDEKCTTQLREDTLVTVNGKPPIALYRTMSHLGHEFEVYLDFLPQEGELVVFNQGWFFAKSYDYPYYRHKVRIITETMPINIRIVAGE